MQALYRGLKKEIIMFEAKIGKNVEFTVKCSNKIALIARLIGEDAEGFYFEDEIKGEKFAIRRSDITSIRSL